MREKIVVSLVCVALGAGCSSGEDSDSASPGLDAGEVVDALADAGIPIGETVVWDEATDPNELLGRPGQYTGKATWTDTRVEPCYDGQPDWDCGGDVEVFGSGSDLDERFEYLSLFAAESGIGGYYMWKADDVIVRVGYELPPSAASTYEDALQEIFADVEAFEP